MSMEREAFMKWDHLSITNTLLLIIAILLLVLVAGGNRHMAPTPTRAPALSDMGSAPQMQEASDPHAGMQMQTPENFNFQNMIFAALSCPEDQTITLADFGCAGDEASERRQFVKNLNAQGLPPRALFDQIIETYGEDALTDEAMEIRKNNRAAQ